MKKAFCGRILALVIALTLFAAAALAGEKCFLWKMQSKTSTVFILGSVHLAKPDIYPLPEKIEESFDKSSCPGTGGRPGKSAGSGPAPADACCGRLCKRGAH